MLTRYIKNKRNEKVGVVIANKIDGKIVTGWSKICRGDKFDRKKGLLIAEARARCSLVRTRTKPIPRDVVVHLEDIQERAERYFKDKEPSV